MFDRNGNDSSTYNQENIAEIRKTSPRVADLIEKEYNRQKNNVELIASENYCSEAVMAACGSCLSWKYAEGYPAKPIERHSGNKGRYYGGTRYVDELEEYCCDMWRKVFDTDYHVNVQPHSGSQANFAAYKAVLEPGDTILSLNLDNGGHLTHGSAVNFSGKLYDVHFYNVDENGFIDMEDLKKKANELHPKLILTGASAYSRTIDFPAFAEIAKSVDAYFMVDMAHIAGLVAGGEHISPFGYADIITTTTHKTLRGPRGGMIFCRTELAKKVDSAVFPYAQGGPLEHIIAGKAVCAEEALRPEFKEYAHQVVVNCKAFAEEFIKMGYNVVTGGTDNHVFLLDLSDHEFSGRDLQNALDEVGITLNKNCVPNEKRSPMQTSGVRVGTAPMTTRGYKEEDFIKVAHRIDEVVKQLDAEKAAEK
ncbi:serine hydroxymethyltransferase [Mogibacterium sp.]|uniref:serine hydroxymethyltransferase n=1 Tax=Mogibacterium sp. TaxID=2049035 RepID=UPI00257AB1F3|nr:serine hydroxymethyltransferase [Mogibacterium sp.]MBN2936099.1 serine hydroxymethyltransferase [Mogibacterium sp.]